MLAFHNDTKIKEKYLSRVISHYNADEIEKGFYWENGKGCAVGCTIHGSNHEDYETELGIPRILARLEDGIFENLPNGTAKKWPKEFLEAINVGADLSGIWPKFAVWLLTDKKYGVLQYAKTDKQKIAIKNVAELYTKHKTVSREEWNKARGDVYDASEATYDSDAASAYASDVAAAAAAAYDTYKYKHMMAQASKLIRLLKACK